MYTLELGPWARKGGKGAYINLAYQYEDDAYIVEIPPGGQLNPEHHMFEALIFVLTGRGATTVWGKDTPKRTVEWKPGSPSRRRSTCGTSTSTPAAPSRPGCWPSRASLSLRAVPQRRLHLQLRLEFNERFPGEDDYFTDRGRLKRLFWKTNFVPDVRSFALEESPGRGPGFNMKFSLSETP